MTSKNLIPWKHAFAKEEIAKLGKGYSHGMYSRAKSVIVDVDVSDDEEDSHDI